MIVSDVGDSAKGLPGKNEKQRGKLPRCYFIKESDWRKLLDHRCANSACATDEDAAGAVLAGGEGNRANTVKAADRLVGDGVGHPLALGIQAHDDRVF